MREESRKSAALAPGRRGRALPRRSLIALAAVLAVPAAVGLAGALGAESEHARRPVFARVYHVGPEGSDGNAGDESNPFRSVRKAVSVAGPGDTIKVHAGTYEGVVQIRRSGREGAPIVLTGAGDGEARLVADFRTLDCSERSPTRDRTLQILGGADHWTIRDLTVVNGILIMASGTQRLKTRDFVDRTLPGRGEKPSPGAGEGLLPSLGIDGSDYIRLINLDVSGRGLLTIAARHGELAQSRIHDIRCGTGAAVWLNRFSDFWHVFDNEVRNVEASQEHYMSEGIRLGSGSSYGVLERNVVEHLEGPGRGMTADVGASWNVYRGNRVTDTSVSFSEQASGWGNEYLFNVSRNARRVGYMVYGVGGMDPAQRQAVRARRRGRPTEAQVEPQREGEGEPAPEGASTPRFLLFQCNDSQGDPAALQIGDVADSRFLDNNFGAVRISDNLQRTWAEKRNVWNGSPALPGQRPPTASFASCRAEPEPAAAPG